MSLLLNKLTLDPLITHLHGRELTLIFGAEVWRMQINTLEILIGQEDPIDEESPTAATGTFSWAQDQYEAGNAVVCDDDTDVYVYKPGEFAWLNRLFSPACIESVRWRLA